MNICEALFNNNYCLESQRHTFSIDWQIQLMEWNKDVSYLKLSKNKTKQLMQETPLDKPTDEPAKSKLIKQKACYLTCKAGI